MSVNDFCRFCATNLRISGILANSKLIFDNKAVDDVSSQLSAIGLTIKNTPHRSYRICRKCCTIISRLLHDTKVLKQWKDNENAAIVETCLEEDATASASTDKRDAEPSPSKTPTAAESGISTNLPVPEGSSMAEEAIENSDAGLDREHILCDSPASDKDRTSNMSVPANPTPSDASVCSVSENNFLKNPYNIKKEPDLPQVTIRYDVSEKQLLQFFNSQCPMCQSDVNMEKVVCGVVFTLILRCPQCGYIKEWRNLNIIAADDAHQTEHTGTTLEMVSDSIPELDIKPANPAPNKAFDCSVPENNILLNPDVKKEPDLPQVTISGDVNEKQLLQLFSSQCPTCQSKVNMEKVVSGVVFTLTLRCPRCGYSKEWKNLNNKNIPAVDDAHQTETTVELVSDSVPDFDNEEDQTSNMSVPVSPTPSEASDCSVSENNVLQNPDDINKTADLPQVKNGYVVNEKQLLQLFSSQCPACQSKVNMEKVVCGNVLSLNLRCPKCDYIKEWKNLNSKNIPAADDAHQTATTVEKGADSVTEFVYLIAEENDQMEISDLSSGPSEKDSGEEWDPEEEVLFYDEPHSESDDDVLDDDEENIPSRLMELCTECGKFFKTGRPHTCEHIIKPFSCNACGKRFINELSLTYHTRVHDANYEVSCKCCHMKFKTKRDKSVHEQKHLTEEKPFKCRDCSETFATYHKRMIHMKVHREGPEGLKCHECGLKFSRKEALRRHLVVHTGEKLYKCVVCERSFNQAGNLKSHMRLHTGERPYKCHHCYQGFNHNVSLKSHIKRYHTPGSENAKKKANKRKRDDEDYEANGSEKGTDSCPAESEEDTDDYVQPKKTYRRKTSKSTGRPKGRPKRNKADPIFQAEETQEQSSDTNT